MEERQEVIAYNMWEFFNEELIKYNSDLNIGKQINEDIRKAIYGNFTRKCIKEWPFAVGVDDGLIDLAIKKTYDWAMQQEDFFTDDLENSVQEFAVTSMNKLAHLILFN
ncbi:MAG: hypothetical protein ACYC27_12460 [Armatimonadota bacterium]